MKIGGGQIRGAFFNFFVVFLHLWGTALSFYKNPWELF